MRPSSLLPLDARYERRSLIGQGGMGEVHRGWDLQLQRAVALKFIHGNDPKQAERLMLEARLQASVIHPHVAQVYETGTLEDRPCLAMQLVDGPPLDRAAIGLALREQVRLLAEASEAVHAAHLQGLLHCDLKPGNILVETDAEGHRTAFVTDFGLARSLDPSGHTRTQSMAGTLWFMAPELLSGTVAMDVRTEVYSLGATLYAVLASHPPFADDTRSVTSGSTETTAPQRADLRRLISEDPTPLRTVNPSIPKALERIAAMAMDKEPGRRYPSALAFAADLHAFLEGRPLQAQAEGSFGRSLRWARRNPIATRSLGLGALALLAAGGTVLWNANRTAALSAHMAQLGSEAKGLETDLRMAALEPPHDLRPLLTKVRQRLERLHAEEKGLARGPAAYALARGHMALGEWELALEALARADGAAFHSPEVEGARLEIHLALFLKRYAAALKETDPTLREARTEEARRDHLVPIQKRLPSGEPLPPLLRAQLAMAEGRTAEGLQLAREAQGPGAFEAHRLEGQIASLAQRQASAEGRFDDALRAGAEARKALARALEIARSDRAAQLMLAQSWEGEVGVLRNLQRPTAAALREGQEALARALALDPDWGEAWLFQSSLAVEEGRGNFARPEEAERAFERAAAAAGTAAAQPGLQQAAQEMQLWALVNLEYVRAMTGKDTRALVEEGVGLGRALVKAHPTSIEGRRRLAACLVSASESRSGEAAIALLEEALDHARWAVKAAPGFFGPRATLAQVCSALGQAQAMQGGNPERLFQEGLDGLESFLTGAPTNLEAQQSFIQQARVAATFQMKRHQTPEPFLGKAHAMATRLLQAAPDSADLLMQAADLASVEASWRLETRQDPTAALDETEAHLRRALQRLPKSALAHQGVGEARLFRGLWRLQHLQDPTRDLTSAESSLKEAERLDPKWVGTQAILARVHLARATWSTHLGALAWPEVQRGLDRAERVLKAQPGRSGCLVVRLELLLLAAEGSAPRERETWLAQAKATLETLQALPDPPSETKDLETRYRALSQAPA